MADESGLSVRRLWIGGIGSILIVGSVLVGGVVIARRKVRRSG